MKIVMEGRCWIDLVWCSLYSHWFPILTRVVEPRYLFFKASWATIFHCLCSLGTSKGTFGMPHLSTVCFFFLVFSYLPSKSLKHRLILTVLISDSMHVEIFHEKSDVSEERKIKWDLSRVLSDAAVKARRCLVMLCVKENYSLRRWGSVS